MSFSLKDIIFKKFGFYEAKKDTFKTTFTTGDKADKGIQQRFQEAMAIEWDDEIHPEIESLYANVLSPFTLEAKFLKYYEGELGIPFVASLDESVRRKAIIFNRAFVAKKGTEFALKMWFNLLGIADTSYTITQTFPSFTFDDDVATFDFPSRTFDSKCLCPIYTIDVDTATLTNDQVTDLFRILPAVIEWNEPVTAKLGEFTYFHISMTTAKNGTVTLNFVGTGIVVIDWGDGAVESFDMSLGAVSHIYLSSEEKTILLNFDDVDNFISLDFQNNCITSLFIADVLLNNDTDFTLNLRGNFFTDESALSFLTSTITRSDALQTNSILVNLLDNNLSSPIEQTIKDLKFDLRDNHDIEVLLGGGFTIGYTEGFNAV